MGGNETPLGPIAELRGVSFGFRGHSGLLLRTVKLQLFPGETVLLAGPNGCGKSTVLGLLSGRLCPQSGTVWVLGQDPFQADRLPAVGLITEPFHPSQSPLPVGMSVRQVLTWLTILDKVPAAAMDRWRDALRVSSDLLDRPLDHLSKGERQRMMLLVVLLRCPRLILADEPLEGVDIKSRDAISAALSAYAKLNQAAIVWVEHHVAETARYADRILRLVDGTVVEKASSTYTIQFRSSEGVIDSQQIPHLYVLPELIAKRLCEDPARVELAVGIEERT